MSRNHAVGHHKPIDETLAMLALGGGGGVAEGSTYAFVYRPGGVADKNVFTTEATLKAAMSSVQGPKLLQIDNSFGPATFASAWPASAIDGVRIVGMNFNSQLDLLAGTTFTANMITLDTVTLHSEATAPVWTPSSSGVLTVFDSVISAAAGAAPFLDASAFPDILTINSEVGDGVAPVITSSSFMGIALLSGSNLGANAITGAGTANIGFDASSPITTPQPIAAETLFPLDNASEILYAPGVPGNWNPAPSRVAAALDALAAPNELSQTNGAAMGPSSPVAFTSTGFTKAKSGRVRLSGMLGVTGVASGTEIVFQLLRDATVLATQKVDMGSTIGQCTMSIVDTLPDLLTHHYSIQASVGVGALSIAIGAATISADEIN